MEVRTPSSGGEIKEAARAIAGLLSRRAFTVESGSTCLLLNSLLTAHHSHRRIYLNAFQRSGEILHHLAHRLHRLEFNVHSLDPWSVMTYPKPQDVLLTLSGSLETEPVLVTLLHADREELYRFVITAQPVEETRHRFQGVLPVHLDGVTSSGHAVDPETAALLPLGSLFELRAFVYFEALVELLTGSLEAGAAAAADPAACPELSPGLLAMLGEARRSSGALPETMEALVEQFTAAVERIDDGELGRFVALIEDTARKGNAVYVAAYGRANQVAGLFAHRLANLGLKVAMTPSRIERPSRPGDLLLALSGAGSTFEVLQRMSGARRGGLHTAAITASAGTPIADYADALVLVPAAVEPRFSSRDLGAGRQHPPAPRPLASTFGLNALLVLEATVTVLMRRLGKGEASLTHTDPWQGF